MQPKFPLQVKIMCCDPKVPVITDIQYSLVSASMFVQEIRAVLGCNTNYLKQIP